MQTFPCPLCSSQKQMIFLEYSTKYPNCFLMNREKLDNVEIRIVVLISTYFQFPKQFKLDTSSNRKVAKKQHIVIHRH